MTQEKVAALIAQYKDNIPEENILVFKRSLESAPDTAYDALIAVPLKSKVTTLLLSIFLGGLGVDRFYIGDIGIGIAKLIFGWWTFGIWPLVDIFCCYKKAKQKNFAKLMLNF